eukprot:5857638-Amphidinium_carterae.1
MSDLISDNRLLQQSEALQAQLSEEVMYLLSLPSSVWSFFSLHARCSAETLRDLVVKGAMITWGYLDVKIFQSLCFYPWSLVVGDIDKNLADLIALPAAPEHPLAAQLWSLSHAGMSDGELRSVLALLSNVSWTSHMAERLHSSAGNVMKHHADYAADMMSARSFVHMLR